MQTNSSIKDNLELRREYQEKKFKYDRLLRTVSLILRSTVEKNNVNIHSIKNRIKNYTSFLEKIERKNYTNPFVECTDIAGCRIICLFTSQAEKIKNLVHKEFDVLEVSDQRNSKKFDQFGYLSLHMLVKIPKNRATYVEYEGLSNLVCEIQIRTILQEAWAEIEHYLNYKATKEEKDQELLRKIFSLAGMFEVADATFEDINNGFQRLVSKQTFDSNNVTALALYKLALEQFIWYNKDWTKKEERTFLRLSHEIKKMNIRSIGTIKKIIQKHKSKLDSNLKMQNKMFGSPAELIRAGLALEYGKKFDLVYGLRGYSDKIKGEFSS